MGKTRGAVVPFRHGPVKLEAHIDEIGRLTVELETGQEGKDAEQALDFYRGKCKAGYLPVISEADARYKLRNLGADCG